MKFTEVKKARPWLLVFDGGDDVLEVLRRFAGEQGIRGGWFTAIGALDQAAIAYWNAESLQYERIDIREQVEVLAFTGDIGMENDAVKIHAHVVLGRRDGAAIGGHFLSGRVFPTLEMNLTDFGMPVARRRDARAGLSLISLAP